MPPTVLTPNLSANTSQVLELRHGVMMVGPSGSGKTSAWRCLLSAMESVDGVKGEAHVIDPKSIGETPCSMITVFPARR